MKKIVSIIICVLLCGLVFTGCGIQKEVEVETEPVENDAAILGKWTEKEFLSGYTFNEDGTGTNLYWNEGFTYTAVDGELVLQYENPEYAKHIYTYTVTETSLTLDPKDSEHKTFTYDKN